MYQKLAANDVSVVLQALGLHLPDPPLESEDEDEEGAAALSSHSSIPMDPGTKPKALFLRLEIVTKKMEWLKASKIWAWWCTPGRGRLVS